jgi:hypothetical protein
VIGPNLSRTYVRTNHARGGKYLVRTYRDNERRCTASRRRTNPYRTKVAACLWRGLAVGMAGTTVGPGPISSTFLVGNEVIRRRQIAIKSNSLSVQDEDN